VSQLDLLVRSAGRELAESAGQMFMAARADDRLSYLRAAKAAADAVTRVRDQRSPDAAVELLVEEICARARTVVALIEGAETMIALVGLPPALAERMVVADTAITAVSYGDDSGVELLVRSADRPLSFGLQLLFDLVQVTALVPGAKTL
jgi:hypothetical protein